MKTLQLQNELKKSGTAYLFYFLFGAHYIYLGQTGKQILFWCTFGGLGIWALIDLFTLSSKVDKVNAPILKKIDDLQRDEKDEKFKKDLIMMQNLKK
ncbi:NINE protein [Tenacibaculum piscium]|uniref:TM2 domain-containing protein n=1 Tax=Tenacibaculum piscium TaxID=1458515 RepID=UPI00187B867E|nr:TM2 domain-containing protein [Tenacibaculum piscium]MBE7686511.1 NINE protein [Tenacibaculum piscium]